MAEIRKYTKEGYEKLKEEYSFRVTEERERIKQAIAEARSYGDLSENADYDAARDAQASNEARIKELEDLIDNAEIVDDSQQDSDVVGFGSSVKIEKGGKVLEFKIVGSNETDPLSNKISGDSHIGKALIGAKKDDTVTVETPKGTVTIKVLDVFKVK